MGPQELASTANLTYLGDMALAIRRVAQLVIVTLSLVDSFDVLGSCHLVKLVGFTKTRCV